MPAIDIDPKSYFMSWEYEIKKAHYPAFDIELRDLIDKPKTQELRARAEANLLKKLGVPFLDSEEKKWVTKHFKIIKKVWRQNQPVNHQFQEGDMFHHKRDKHWIQVADEDVILEVHSNQSGISAAYKLHPHILAHWLKTGDIPTQYEIPAAQCKREFDRLSIGHYS
jgi:hypothetical protein